MKNYNAARAREHALDRSVSFSALGISVSTSLLMTAISMRPETSSLTAIFAGAVAGGIGYFGTKYFLGVQAALDKSHEERILAAKRVLKFGPFQACALALTMSGTAAITYNVNGNVRHVHEEYQRALNTLPVMDPDTVQSATQATARETFCADHISGKTLVRRADGLLMSLNCGVQ